MDSMDSDSFSNFSSPGIQIQGLNGSLECGEMPDIATIKVWRYWVSGVLTSCTGILGLVGNSLSLLVLCKRSMRNVFTHLLCCLCIADLLFIISNLLLTPLSFGMKHFIWENLAPSAEILSHLSLALSIFLTVGITAERHLSVHNPAEYAARLIERGHLSLVLLYLAPSLVASLLFNIPRIVSHYRIDSSLESSPEYVRFYIGYQIMHPLTTTGLAPLIVLSLLNWRIHSRIPHSRLNGSRGRAKDFSLARICCILVLVFLFLNLPRLLIGLHEVSKIGLIFDCYMTNTKFYTPTWQWCADSVARYTVVLNSSVNFIIYCLAGSQFRAELAQLLKLKNSCSTLTVYYQPENSQRTDAIESRISINGGGRILKSPAVLPLQPKHLPLQCLENYNLVPILAARRSVCSFRANRRPSLVSRLSLRSNSICFGTKLICEESEELCLLSNQDFQIEGSSSFNLPRSSEDHLENLEDEETCLEDEETCLDDEETCLDAESVGSKRPRSSSVRTQKPTQRSKSTFSLSNI